MIDKVLLPNELFKAQAETQTLALAPEKEANCPKVNKKKTKKAPSLSGEVDTPSADNTAD